MEDIPMDFKVTKYAKYTEKVSDSSLELTFMKLALVKHSVISKKKIHNYLKQVWKYTSLFQLHNSVRLEFLQIL